MVIITANRLKRSAVMSYLIKQSSTARPLMFLMIDSVTHIDGKTGLTPNVTISKNGAAFATPAGAVSELSGGWYQVAANAIDSQTLGVLLLHAESAGADPSDKIFEIVAFDPDLVAVGANTVTPTNLSAAQVRTELATELARIDAAITSRSTFAGGAVESVTGAVGSVTAAILLPSIPNDWITAAGIAANAIGASELAADAVTEIQSGLATIANQTSIIDTTSFIASGLFGAIANAGTATETYAITINGGTFTATGVGLDATGNRTSVGLVKS